MAEIRVAPVGVEDATEVARVHTLARAAYYRAAEPNRTVPGGDLDYEPMWRRGLGSGDDTVLGATQNDRLVGFVAVSQAAADTVELVALYVEPDRWGEGIASRLLEALDHRVEGSTVTLDVWNRNDRAIRFYLDRGWQLTGASRPAHEGTAYLAMEKRA